MYSAELLSERQRQVYKVPANRVKTTLHPGPTCEKLNSHSFATEAKGQVDSYLEDPSHHWQLSMNKQKPQILHMTYFAFHLPKTELGSYQLSTKN